MKLTPPEHLESWKIKHSIGKCRKCCHMSMQDGQMFCGHTMHKVFWKVTQCGMFKHKDGLA